MIVGHEVTNDTLRIFIFSFHMPLFFILSGYTSGPVQEWGRFLVKVKKIFKYNGLKSYDQNYAPFLDLSKSQLHKIGIDI